MRIILPSTHGDGRANDQIPHRRVSLLSVEEWDYVPEQNSREFAKLQMSVVLIHLSRNLGNDHSSHCLEKFVQSDPVFYKSNKEEIKRALDNIYIHNDSCFYGDLCTTALCFRLLRQHGYDVSQDVFDRYKDDEMGSLKMCLSEDVKGMLSLYEASYFGLEGKDFMDEAKAFTTRHLRDIKGNINPTLAKKVAHSLEHPLHWRISRLETRWYIDTYESEDNMVALLLDLAKLDYNMVQATYQSEIKGLISLIGDDTFALPFWQWDAPKGMVTPAMYMDGAFTDTEREETHVHIPRIADINYDYNDTEIEPEQRIKKNLAFMYHQMVSGAKKVELFMG
ncbi:hypothetical protein IFM89_016280, partial [Coptis chinensis]